MTSSTLEPSAKKPMTICRDARIAETVVLSNGLPGCGKTMLAPIISSLARVELMRYATPLENVCILRHFEQIESQGAVSMIKILTDQDLYQSMMSRETNFRFSDLSSVWRYSHPWRYVKRLFLTGDSAIIPRIQKEHPILHLVTHNLLGISRVLFDALQERLRIIEVVRHPLYMVKQWYTWMPEVGITPRGFTPWVQFEGRSLPWFAFGWEELFLRSNAMDRTIYAMDHLWRLSEKALKELSPQERQQVQIIPFEQYVTNPEPFMQDMEKLLGTTMNSATRRMMKKQKVPRKMYADGIGLKIYRYYGWEPPTKGASEKEEFEKRRKFVAAEASPKAMELFDNYCHEYEAAHLK